MRPTRHAERAGAGRVEDPAFGAVRLLGRQPAEPEPVEASAAAQVAAMIYTSGTTGEPKGVMLSHANLLFIASVSGRLRALGPGDLVYAALPLSHVFGLASTFLTRLRLGPQLVDARAVPALYAGRVRAWQLWLVLLCGLLAVVAAIAVTPVGQQWYADLHPHLTDLTDSARGLFP